MPTVSRGLPNQPHLDVPKRLARELLNGWRAGQPDTFDRIRRRHPKLSEADDSAIKSAIFKLSDAQLVIAREYGFSNWTQLKERIDGNTVAGLLHAAIRADDRETVVRLLRANPNLLHVPVQNGNWGPPMSHAANMGRLEIIKAVAELGARDYQHAFDRALLQGQIECAQWFYDHGAKLAPGIVMGCCETQDADGFRFLAERNAPMTDAQGNRMAPLAMVIETYCRKAVEKRAIFKILSQRGYSFPDTPMTAFHQGHIDRLKEYLRRDPRLIERRFSYREIYPRELGCADDGRSGMHWTPIAGTTLLHLAIDFHDREIFDWLLDNGADVNARAEVDSEGFGGHTPLFNAVVCGPGADAEIAKELLRRGASPNARANLRKFLDWTETPRWHIARDVTPAEWARTFPDRMWVNHAAVQAVEGPQLNDLRA